MGSLYRSQHELVWVFKQGTAPHTNNVELGKHGRYRSNLWTYPGANSFGADRDEVLAHHPTPKNTAMLADAILDVTHPNELVIDFFLGSGTTLLAAERTGRICYGIEIDPLYVGVTIDRWERATGQRATLAGTGQTIDEVAAERGVRKGVAA
jgi:DNA modification methylase